LEGLPEGRPSLGTADDFVGLLNNATTMGWGMSSTDVARMEGRATQAIAELRFMVMVKGCRTETNAGGQKEKMLGTWSRLVLRTLLRKLHNSTEPVARVILTAFGGCLLDVGAGTGELLAAFATLFKTVHVCCFSVQR
jgi:2-polyprenyl-3-methyl-5-hydroxy-6-metoxy-1,4-benzoquinol methylase